jgi:hypothetical protein
LTWIRAANPSEDKFLVDKTSVASGTTRNGRSYTVTLLSDLEYQRFCGIAIRGKKQYLLDGEKEVLIDYGDGNCDKSITITVNGITRSITVN